MTSTAQRDAAPLQTDRPSPAAPVFLWLLIQLAALSLGAFRVPLAARLPPPGGQFAVHTLVAVQIAASALLFPFLLRGAATTLFVILATLPFLQLSSYVSAMPLERTAFAAAHVACWIVTLALWLPVLRTPRTQMLGVGVAVAWSIGTLLVWYARAEAGADGRLTSWREGAFGPIVGGITQLNASTEDVKSALIPSALLLISALASSAAQTGKRAGPTPVE